MEIGRLLTAMVTPFDDEGQVDYEQARRLARALLDSGSDGLVVAGTTGEAPTLSHDEKLRLFAAVKEAVGGRGAVLAGTGTNNTLPTTLSVNCLLNDPQLGAINNTSVPSLQFQPDPFDNPSVETG
ncbi:hypothetical protein LCGC14_2929020, partial [marine sediment metagenome]